jgi:hypothetical protein
MPRSPFGDFGGEGKYIDVGQATNIGIKRKASHRRSSTGFEKFKDEDFKKLFFE